MRGSAWAAVMVVGALGSMATAGASCGTEFTTTTGGSGGGTGGSSSSGGTSSTSSSGMSSTSSSGMTGTENCFNGVDDNDNGLIDCADPECDPVAVCVPVFDAWQGPNATAFTVAGTGVPACPPEWQQQGPSFKGGDINAPGFECSCSCGPVQGACTGKANLNQYLSPGCGGAASSTTVPQGQCNAIAAVGGLLSVKATPPQVGSGSCEATTLVTNMPGYSASNKAFLCGPTAALIQGGCADGQVCAARPKDAAFDLCIVTDGDHGCPPEYPNAPAEQYYGSFEDSRGCADCTCGNPANVSCGGQVDLYNDPAACGGVPAQSLPLNTCVDISNQVGLGYGVYVPKTDGTCQASTPAPIGEVNGNPITFCCK